MHNTYKWGILEEKLKDVEYSSTEARNISLILGKLNHTLRGIYSSDPGFEGGSQLQRVSMVPSPLSDMKGNHAGKSGLVNRIMN